jgi:hypothetical protein
MARQLHVLRAANGGWVVKPPGPEIASTHATQPDAVSRARRSLHRVGGGELVLHGRDGQIMRRDWVGPPPQGGAE